MPTQEDFDHCHLYRHAWDEYDGDPWIPPFGMPFTLRCTSCASLRREILSSMTGERLAKPYYVYTPGYRYRKGEPKPTMNDLRLIRLRKQLEQKREDRIERRRVNGNGRRRKVRTA